MRLLLLCLLAISQLAWATPEECLSSYEKCFVVVGVSGFGTNEEGNAQPSGAHDNLPFEQEIAATFKITHGAKNKKLDEVLASFNCQDGKQGQQHLGLIIMANSWGAGKATKLARRYQKQCGKVPELFVIVDGINKPLPTSFSQRPPALRCVNYYQDYSTLRGREIQGCENHNLRDSCQSGGMANCHITVEWEGTAAGSDLISQTIRNSR